jgi:hypothetical protein
MKPATDLTGRVFGRLKVIARAGSTEGKSPRPLWRCLCVCGGKRVVPAAALVAGRTRSCGCLRAELARSTIGAARRLAPGKPATDLTGRVFGRLKVIARAGSTAGKSPRPLWRCRCVCGDKHVVSAAALVAGDALSCGCLRAEQARSNAARAKRRASSPSRQRSGGGSQRSLGRSRTVALVTASSSRVPSSRGR